MISIIIPVYNGEKFIHETVRRILQSTYSDLEIVLVNDGSTDSSKTICENLAQSDSRIFCYTKENGGVVSARNYGVEKAGGDFICFCDQDDYVEREMYDRLINKMTEDGSQIGMCSTGRNIEGKKSDFEVLSDACFVGEEIATQILFPLLFNGYHVPLEYTSTYRYPHIWNCMFRRDFWEQSCLRFRAYINYEDDLLVKVEALSRAQKISTISYRGYYWRVNLESETYAHRFVKDMGKKQQLVLEDMERSLSYCIQDEHTMLLFAQVTRCKQYLDAVHNLTSPQAPKEYCFIKQYFCDNIYNRDFKESIKARRYLKKGMIKPHVILPLLSARMSLLTFWSEKLLDWILLVTLRSQTLTKLERWLKREKR